jgi:hypothetical protein
MGINIVVLLDYSNLIFRLMCLLLGKHIKYMVDVCLKCTHA